jgi:hypothetical protein
LLFFLSIALVVSAVTDAEAQQRRRKIGKGGRPVEIMAGLDEAATFRGQSEEGFKDWVTRNANFPDDVSGKAYRVR